MDKLLTRTRRISQGQAFEKQNMHGEGPELEYFSELVCGKEILAVGGGVVWKQIVLRARVVLSFGSHCFNICPYEMVLFTTRNVIFGFSLKEGYVME